MEKEEINLNDLSPNDLARELILARYEKKSIEDRENAIIDLLKASMDFEAITIEWITVRRKQRKNISLLPNADLSKIKERYPDLVQETKVINTKVITPDIIEKMEKAYPWSVDTKYDVDTRLLHECTKEYTEQKITTFIEVK